MRALLKGKTQEFIPGGITPSGLATQMRRGIIRGFDAASYRATVQLLGSLSVWLEGVPVAKHLGGNLLSNGVRCGVLFFDESNPSDACVAFVYDGAPGAWVTSSLVVEGTITAADCLSNVAGGVATIDASGDLGPPNHVRAAGRFYPGGQGTRYLYDAGATSGLAVAGGPFSAMGRIYPGTGSALQALGYITCEADGDFVFSGGNVGLGASPISPLTLAYSSGAANRGIMSTNSSNDSAGDILIGRKIRNTSIVQNGDGIWTALGRGYDGGNYIDCAAIAFVVDGGPGANDMPGRIGFYTTSDGASTLTERARIRSSGVATFLSDVGIGSIAMIPNARLEIQQSQNSNCLRITRDDAADQWLNVVGIDENQHGTGFTFQTNDWNITGPYVARTALHIAASGNVGIGTTGPGARLDVKGTGNSSNVQQWTNSNGNLLGLLYQSSGGAGQFYLADSTGTYKNVIKSDGDSYFNGGNVGIGTAAPDTFKLQVAGNIGTTGYLYPGTGAALQSSRYIKDDGATLVVYGGLVLDIGSGNTPLVFKRGGSNKWLNYTYSVNDGLWWASYSGGWHDKMGLDASSGDLYIDGSYLTFSPVPPKEDMSPEEYLAWAMEDASKPPKPYADIPREPAELGKYRKDISKIAIGVARYVDHLRTQVGDLEARLTRGGL